MTTNWSPKTRQCEWCGATFEVPRRVPRKRFCNTSCSAKWRMRQPDVLAKVHSPEVAAKRGQRRREWFQSGSPEAQREIERIRALNPTSRPEVRAKISATLKAMGHGPAARGGNGHGLTAPQQALLDALGPAWRPEFTVGIKPRGSGYPTHYKLDLALPALRLGVECDGYSHCSRRALDEKKDAKLATLGWTVLRFSNREILSSIDSVVAQIQSRCTTLT